MDVGVAVAGRRRRRLAQRRRRRSGRRSCTPASRSTDAEADDAGAALRLGALPLGQVHRVGAGCRSPDHHRTSAVEPPSGAPLIAFVNALAGCDRTSSEIVPNAMQVSDVPKAEEGDRRERPASMKPSRMPLPMYNSSAFAVRVPEQRRRGQPRDARQVPSRRRRGLEYRNMPSMADGEQRRHVAAADEDLLDAHLGGDDELRGDDDQGRASTRAPTSLSADTENDAVEAASSVPTSSTASMPIRGARTTRRRTDPRGQAGEGRRCSRTKSLPNGISGNPPCIIETASCK